MSWSGVSTLGRVVAHWRGLSRVARVSPCAALSGRRAGTSGQRARHATAAPLLATLVTQGRGQWGSHWRRQKAAAATVEAAPKQASPAAVGQTLLLLLCWTSAPACCWPVSLASVYGGATHPTVAPAPHPVIGIAGRGGANYTVLGNEDL